MEMVIKQRASIIDGVLAFVLLAKNYQRKGYFRLFSLVDLCTLARRFCDFVARVHLYNLDPLKGQVVVAKRNNRVIGTVSLSFNPDTTPIDMIFPDELMSLRQSGKSFVYLGGFAVCASVRCTRLSLRMLREVWSTSQTRGIDVGICVVHPDHSGFYKRFGFTELATSIIPELDHAPCALLVIQRHAVRL
jgi:predicted N-acetyltransferase YhbS